MKKIITITVCFIYSITIYAQVFSDKMIVMSNTGATKIHHLIIPVSFGEGKEYYVKHIQGSIHIIDIQDEVEIEISVIEGFNQVNLVDFRDFNNDGLIDILTDLGPIYNQGNEIFGEIEIPDGIIASGRIIRYVDFNNDNIIDIISTKPNTFSDSFMYIYLMDENQEIMDEIVIADADEFEVLQVTDFNQDGFNDIIFAADPFGSDRLVYLENNGDNSFVATEVSSFSISTRLMMLVDLDNDGDEDVINPGKSGDLDWVENVDNSLGMYAELDGDTEVIALEVGDFNNDGKQDILVLDDSNSNLYKILLFLGNGDGTIQESIEVGEVAGLGSFPVTIGLAFENWMTVKDINNDGYLDIFVNEIANENFVLFESQAFIDNDEDGFNSDEDCDDSNPAINPDAEEIANNDIDENCDGIILVIDNDEDGFNSDEDCDDSNPAINPDAEEIANNGIDEDCDGMDLIDGTYQLADVTVEIFPNPAHDFIKIETKGEVSYAIRLFDIGGKLLVSGKNMKIIDISTFLPGVYVLKIKDLDSNQQLIERVVIER